MSGREKEMEWRSKVLKSSAARASTEKREKKRARNSPAPQLCEQNAVNFFLAPVETSTSRDD